MLHRLEEIDDEEDSSSNSSSDNLFSSSSINSQICLFFNKIIKV